MPARCQECHPRRRSLVSVLDFLTGYVMGQRSAARAASHARGAATAAASTTAGQLYDLDRRIDRLLLVTDAMWSLLREQGFTDEQLAERIRQLDEEDGILDGIRRHKPVRCPACESVNEPGRSGCVICGKELPVPSE